MTEAPGWKRANPETRAQIADACLPYLKGFPPSEEWLDPGKSFYPALAGYRALRYLHDHDNAGLEALGDEILGGWVPAVLSFVGGGGESGEQEARESILARMAERCPATLAQVAREAIEREAARW